MNKNLNLSEGKVFNVLLKFTFPILISQILQVTYGTVDLLIVGQYAGVGDVSGVTIGSQIMQAITSFCTGISMGTTILLGRYIGAKKEDKTTATVGVSIALFAVLTAVITSVLLLGNGFIAQTMNTPAESFAQTKSYLFVCGMGAVFIVFYNLIGSIFRGIGDSNTPLIAVLIACIVNIILDLVLVGIFEMGATGAAIATVMAQGISVAISFWLIKKKTLPFTLTWKAVGFDKEYVIKILQLGTPIALQGVLVSVSFLAITSIVNGFGVASSAALGIVEKITGIIMLIPISFMQSLAAFTAQNYGAGKLYRAKKGLKYGMSLSLMFGVVMSYLAIFHGSIFTRLFTSDIEITGYALLYMKAYAIDVVLVAILFSMTGYFNGYGKTNFVMIQAVTGAFCIRIPLAYMLSNLANTSLFIIGLATPSATVIQIIACFIYYRHLVKHPVVVNI
ncbi:MAG: MATE family efflux transporter [Eubacteriales bacterium]